MRPFLRRMTILFSAGLIGGLANRLIIWIFGVAGITQALGVQFAPPLNVDFVYPGLIWGGIWGWIFLLPWYRDPWVIQGLVLSLAPTAVMLFFILPFRMDQGMAGMQLGALMPLLVLLFNAVWGVTATGWLRLIKSE